MYKLRYYARVDRVYPPKYNADSKARDARIEYFDADPPHLIGSDLKIPNEEVIANDDPALYYYWVYLTELERDKSHEKAKASMSDKPLVGSLIEVSCKTMRYVPNLVACLTCVFTCRCASRDRLSFSKSILRRFIRDCVDRDAAVASPWTVKPAIAERYGVESVMPEETRQGVENIKKGEIDKRKKVWEDKEGPPTKKFKLTNTKNEKGWWFLITG